MTLLLTFCHLHTRRPPCFSSFSLCVSLASAVRSAWIQAEALIPAIDSGKTKLAFILARLCASEAGEASERASERSAGWSRNARQLDSN